MKFLTSDIHNGQSRKGYNFSVLAIFRNEAHAMKEWIDHYLSSGVEHFYLINNRSVDSYYEILSPYISTGTVELFHCEEEGFQIGAYTELLPQIQRETEWIGVFDLDEFVYPVEGGSMASILNRFSAHNCILIPWLSFGSNGHIDQPRSIIDNFTMRGDAAVSRAFLKAISRPLDITYFSQHNPTLRRSNKVLSNGDPGGENSHIALLERHVLDYAIINNHYRLQSLNYFKTVKTTRPEVHEDVKESIKKISFFKENDERWSTVADMRLRNLRASLNAQTFEIQSRSF